jgi:diguanylate cyclase (GGDEF)-like protein
MIQRILSCLDHGSKRAITLLGLALVPFIGVLDVKTGVETHLLCFYLIPITVVSWFVNRNVGICVAMLCTLTWFVADRLGGRIYSAGWMAYWNLGMRAGVFVVVALALSQLRAKFDSVSELANRDFLTGLPNGRAFYELAAREMDRAFGLEPLTLACIDVEGFKWINHRFGYASGDQMLCTLAKIIKEHAPRRDLVGRTGGTAFAVLLPNTTSEGASFVLERIQSALKEERRRHAQPVTFFISAVACTKAPRSVAELMHEAESQMARMKGSNKDTLQIARVHAVPALN